MTAAHIATAAVIITVAVFTTELWAHRRHRQQTALNRVCARELARYNPVTEAEHVLKGTQ